MAKTVRSVLKQVSDFLKNTEKKKLIIIGAVLLAVIIGAIVLSILLNRTTYTVLYSDLSADEAGKIMDVLEKKGVDAKVRGTDTILVPQEQADKLRIELAASGYPNTGLNYDIFSNTSNFTSTDQEELTYKQYQLQENMRTTISKFDKVKDCIVLVNLPQTSSYVVTSSTADASVSIMVKMDDGETLTNTEAKAIAKFAMTCVPDLKMEHISIVDNNMNYYDVTSDNSSDSSQSGYSTSQQELAEKMKSILANQVKTVLTPAIGSDNLAVTVNLNLNFDAQKVDTVTFSPPVEGKTEGLLRSGQEIYDAPGGSGGSAAASGDAGADSNGVAAPKYVSGSAAGSTPSGSYNNTYNYELNQVKTEIQKAQGSVENLSVSVLINGKVDGVSDNMNTIKSLVANAIGVKDEYITVGVMPFVGKSGSDGFSNYLDQQQQAAKLLSQSNLIKMGIAAGAVLLLGALAFLALKKKKHVRRSAPRAEGKGANVDLTAGEPVLEGPGPVDEADFLNDLADKGTEESEKVGELVDKYPEAVAQILRNWLTEDHG